MGWTLQLCGASANSHSLLGPREGCDVGGFCFRTSCPWPHWQPGTPPLPGLQVQPQQSSRLKKTASSPNRSPVPTWWEGCLGSQHSAAEREKKEEVEREVWETQKDSCCSWFWGFSTYKLTWNLWPLAMWILKRVQKELMAQEQLKATTASKTLTDAVARCSLRTAFSENVRVCSANPSEIWFTVSPLSIRTNQARWDALKTNPRIMLSVLLRCAIWKKEEVEGTCKSLNPYSLFYLHWE